MTINSFRLPPTAPAGAVPALLDEVAHTTTTFHTLPPSTTLPLPPLPSAARVVFVLSGPPGCAWWVEGSPPTPLSGGVAVFVVPVGAGSHLSCGAGRPLRVLELVHGLTAEELAPPHPPYTLEDADAKTYKEAIKSPTTTSRTLVPGGLVPRFAAGSVHAPGPDVVGAHTHPMLEQYFLGLPGDDTVVTADGEDAALGEFTLLHIPLGSMHGARVAAGSTMSYVWVDCFRSAEGMAWLANHVDDE